MALVVTPASAANSPICIFPLTFPYRAGLTVTDVDRGTTDIELLYSPGCPHLELARDRLARAIQLTGAGGLRVRVRPVPDGSEHWPSGWGGSPTILLDGVDLFAVGPSPLGAACRLYPTPDGAQGAPSVESLVEALSSRTQETHP